MYRILFLLLCGLGLALPASAQVLGTARGLGAGDAHSARAIGYEAGIYNPANLARSAGSLTFLGLRVGASMSPVSPYDFAGYGSHLEEAEKAEILDRIRDADGQDLTVRSGIHLLGMSAGNFAFNLMTEASARGTLPASAAEVLLYGNVGQSGDAEGFTFEGASARGIVATDAALSYGREIATPIPGQTAAGVTLRYGLIHALGHVWDRNSSVMNDPISASAEGMLVEARGGQRYGVDLGVSWELGPWTAGLTFRDVISGHSISRNKVTVHRVSETVTVDGGSQSNTVELPYNDPGVTASERADVDRHLNAPLSATRVTAAASRTLGKHSAFGQIALGSTEFDSDAAEITVGAMLRPVGFVELRGAANLGTDTNALSGGISFVLGRFALDTGLQRAFGFEDGWTAAMQMRLSR